MISQLASPSVCVVDDEQDDFGPIIEALNALYVSCVHVLGTVESLPSQPFNRLRLVFLDLHLSGTVGKDAASYTANAFTKIVSTDTAPIIVVIWSKYAGDKVTVAGVPPEEQETEAELFRRTLLGAEPRYKGRLIFVEMAKPKKDDRSGDWTENLKKEINRALEGHPAIEALWAWDALVKDGCAHVSDGLTSVAQTAVAGTARELKDGLKATLQRLARAQGEGDFSSGTAPRHLLTALTELLADQLEHPISLAGIASHGNWLSGYPEAVGIGFAAHINALLLTAGTSNDQNLYVPGTVYRIKDIRSFKSAFGTRISSLIDACCQRKRPALKWKDWRKSAHPILIELSPVCDVAQGYRVSSLMVAGVIVSAECGKESKKGDAFGSLPDFKLRWPIATLPEQDVTLVYCHRYKITLPVGSVPAWLEPWFRLRDLPIAAVRNSNAAHAARIGYVSLD